MSFFRTAHETWEKGRSQIVTEADIAIDRLLKERLWGGVWLALGGVRGRPGTRLQRRMVWVVD